MGRPSKLDSTRIARIADALRQGHARGTAAALAGISPSTMFGWMAIAESDNPPPAFSEFLERIKAAEAEAEDTLLAVIRDAAKGGTWQAAAWILERRHSDRWGRKLKAEFATSPQKPDDRAVMARIAEAQTAAELSARVLDYAGKVAFEDWPDEIKRAAGAL